jgi:hypothetical protein
MPGPRPRLRTTASRSGAPCLGEPLHGAAAPSGAGPSHASRRRLVTGSAHGRKADRSKGRPRRSHSRVRVGRVTPTVVLEPRSPALSASDSTMTAGFPRERQQRGIHVLRHVALSSAWAPPC